MSNLKITPQYEHSKFGTFMFNLCARWTEFIIKHRVLYYLLSVTWGALMFIFGLLITLVFGIVKIFNKKIEFHKFYWIYYIKTKPDYWGGLEAGLMFIRDMESGDAYINNHEFGHTFQNTLLGPIAIFLCFIPSAVRYWYQNIREMKGLDNEDYDAFWVEDFATQAGDYAVKYLESIRTNK